MPRLLSVNLGLPRDIEWRGGKCPDLLHRPQREVVIDI